jgi:hypothetical protein
VVEILLSVTSLGVAELPAASSKSDSQALLLCGHRGDRLGRVDGQGAKGLVGPLFGHAPGLEDDVAETLAEIGMKGRHTSPLLRR